MRMRQGRGAAVIATRTTSMVRTRATKICAAHATSRGVGIRKKTNASTIPTASPSRARSTTRVVTVVQNRWPRRVTTYTRSTSPARSGSRLFPM